MGYLSVVVENSQRFWNWEKCIDFDKNLVYHSYIQGLDLLTSMASYTGHEVKRFNGYLI